MTLKNEFFKEVHELYTKGVGTRTELHDLVMSVIDRTNETIKKHERGQEEYKIKGFKIIKSVFKDASLEEFIHLLDLCNCARMCGSYYKTIPIAITPSPVKFSRSQIEDFTEEIKKLGDAAPDICGEVNYRLVPQPTYVRNERI